MNDQIITDSTLLFKSTYYSQINRGFFDELISWSTVINLSFEIIGGFLFLFMLFWFVSPKIKIAKNIAYNNRRGEYRYYFKITNQSYWFKLVDLKMELYEATPINNGLDTRLVQVPLTKAELPYVDSLQKGAKTKEKTFAAQFETLNQSNDVEIDLKEFLRKNESSHISVTFACTHTLSSIRKKFVQNYHLDDIIDGEFEKGKSTEIRRTL